MGLDLAIDVALDGYPVGWFSPTYKMLIDVWGDAQRMLTDITSRRSIQERRIELITGGLLEFWSLDNVDAGRGRKYARIIIDEAAMVKQLMEAWNASIRPTLSDYQGDGWFLSTPKGHDGFWQMYQYGLDDGMPTWASWQMPTSTSPYIATTEIEAARITTPERNFQQEWLAEFLEDAGGVFRRVRDCATADWLEHGRPGETYIYGVDWGKLNDFTAVVVLDMDGRMVHLDRFNQIDYAVQVGRLKALASRFPPHQVVAESNSMGEPLVEQLQRQDLPVQPFQTTNATKKSAIDALSLAFERGDIAILDDPVLIGELQAYQMERLPSGLFRYTAPEGMHDDTVMALALAWTAAAEPQWLLW